MATGYRFRVSAATLTGNELTLTVTNEGVAPLYRDAYFSAGKSRSKKSLKGLLPEATQEYKIAINDEGSLRHISIQSDAILNQQSIQFEADLK